MPFGTLLLYFRLAAFDGLVHALTAHRFVEIDLVPVELRTVHAREARLAADRYQAPHMPVPSTISVFRLTIVFRPYCFVVLATNFIIIIGPMAITSS